MAIYNKSKIMADVMGKDIKIVIYANEYESLSPELEYEINRYLHELIGVSKNYDINYISREDEVKGHIDKNKLTVFICKTDDAYYILDISLDINNVYVLLYGDYTKDPKEIDIVSTLTQSTIELKHMLYLYNDPYNIRTNILRIANYKLLRNINFKEWVNLTKGIYSSHINKDIAVMLWGMRDDEYLRLTKLEDNYGDILSILFSHMKDMFKLEDMSGIKLKDNKDILLTLEVISNLILSKKYTPCDSPILFINTEAYNYVDNRDLLKKFNKGLKKMRLYTNYIDSYKLIKEWLLNNKITGCITMEGDTKVFNLLKYPKNIEHDISNEVKDKHIQHDKKLQKLIMQEAYTLGKISITATELEL